MKQSITLLGTSGVGKTTLSDKLIADGWYHYSGDYRIATHYLYDELQRWLEELLSSHEVLYGLWQDQALKFAPNVAIDNLRALSAFIGKLGKEGLPLSEFRHRQQLFAQAEKGAMYDFVSFRRKATEQGMRYFINDAGGSLGEYIEDNVLMNFICTETLPVYIQADSALQDELEARALNYPKPLCYDPQFLDEMITGFAECSGVAHADDFSCDAFICYVLPHMLAHRHQRFMAIVRRGGVVIDAQAVWQVRDGQDFRHLLDEAIQKQGVDNAFGRAS